MFAESWLYTGKTVIGIQMRHTMLQIIIAN